MTDPYRDVRACLLAQLEVEEEAVLKPYTDTVGKITIGIGRNLTDNGITMDEALALCDTDMTRALGSLERYDWFAGLDAVRQTALGSMMFNLGASRFAGFKNMIAALARNDFEAAAAAAQNSVWSSQTKTRAARIVRMIRTGEWPDDIHYPE